MKNYTTIAEIEAYLLITIDDDFQLKVNAWIEAMEIYIDNITGRNFVAEDGTEKIYDGNGTKKLLIDDIIEIDKLEISSDQRVSFEEVTGFLSYPTNDTPKRKLILEEDVFVKGNQNIKITGDWGYSVAPPEDLKFAATILVAGIINFSMNADGEVESLTVGRYSVSYKDREKRDDFNRAKETLQMYKKLVF